MSRVQVLYVVGAGRSGSTLLTRLLHEQPGYEGLGELSAMSREAAPFRRCGCGLPQRECPRWLPRLRRLAEPGVGDAHRRALEASRLDRFRYGLRPQSPPAAMTEGLDGLRELYQGLAAETGAVLVDESKRTSYGRLLARAPWADVRFVELVRDPRDVVDSWQKPKQVEGYVVTDEGARSGGLKAKDAEAKAKTWLHTLQHSARARRTVRRPWLRLPFSRLLAEPAAVLELVLRAPATGLVREGSEWAFTAGDNHIFGGNPDKLKRGREVLHRGRPSAEKVRDRVPGPYEQRAIRYWERHLADGRVLEQRWR